MANKIKISKGDVFDSYEASDSEDDYTEREKGLLKKVRKNNKRDEESEEEVLGFDQDEDEDNSDFADDKFEGDSDFEDPNADGTDGVPDSRAWGKKRRDYYSTDFVDQDYSSYNDKEVELAEQEESEAREIQQRLAKQLNEGDFTLNAFVTSTTPSKQSAATAEKEDKKLKTLLKSDLSDLSHREQVQLFKKDSPEFEGLVEDFQQRLEESAELLEPIIEYFKLKNISNLPIFDFILTKNNLILAYCSNVAFYLVLKAKRIPIKNHPLIKRLVQMRQLLLQLEEKYLKIIKPQLESLLELIRSGKEITILETVGAEKKQKKSKLNLLTSMADRSKDDQMVEGDSGDEEAADHNPMEEDKLNDSEESDEEQEAEEEEDAEMGDENDERRQITYQMSKNKGLTPHRKKELRNPRVKHRNKFRKALIRRKGAVRTVRKEVKRYGGEISGIKASTKKGIKIK